LNLFETMKTFNKTFLVVAFSMLFSVAIAYENSNFSKRKVDSFQLLRKRFVKSNNAIVEPPPPTVKSKKSKKMKSEKSKEMKSKKSKSEKVKSSKMPKTKKSKSQKSQSKSCKSGKSQKSGKGYNVTSNCEPKVDNPEECPDNQPDFNSRGCTLSESVKCEYGEETCCVTNGGAEETFASLIGQCSGKRWVFHYTEACRNPNPYYECKGNAE